MSSLLLMFELRPFRLFIVPLHSDAKADLLFPTNMQQREMPALVTSHANDTFAMELENENLCLLLVQLCVS